MASAAAKVNTRVSRPDHEQGRLRQKPRAWWLMAILAVLIALYGMAYVVLGERIYVDVLADHHQTTHPQDAVGHRLHTLGLDGVATECYYRARSSFITWTTTRLT